MGQGSRLSVFAQPEVFIGLAFMLVLVPLPWLLGWFLAASFHELCHYLAVRLIGKDISCIEINLTGATMHAGALSERESLFCALSGPLGSLLLLFFSDVFPELALCALMQSIFNLLPVYPQDGGRALMNLAKLILPDKYVNKFCTVIEIAVLSSLFVLSSLALFLWRLGMLPMLFWFILTIRTARIKIPCK